MESQKEKSEVTGPFSEAPGQGLIAEFLEFTKATGTPEAYLLLSHTPPPIHLDWIILIRFEVPLSLRPSGTYIPCAFCRTDDKFLSGCLIWSADGHIRIIGNGCARKNFGEDAYSHADANYRRERIRISKSDYLLEAWPTVGAIISEAEVLQRKARQLEEVSADIRRNAPTIHRALVDSARESGGAMKVVRQSGTNIISIGLRSSDGRASEFHEETASVIRGHQLFRPNRKWSAKLGAAIRSIAPLLAPDAEILERIEIEKSADLVSRAHAIEFATSSIVNIHAELELANQFICADSALALRRWIDHSGHSQRMSVALQGSTLLIWEHGYARAVINLANNPPVPSPVSAIELNDRWR